MTATTTTFARTTSNGNGSSVSSPQAITTASTPASTASDSVADLTERIARLTLAMEARMQSQLSTTTPTAAAAASAPRTYGDRPQHCTWCDSLEHLRRNCTEFTEALQQQRVRLNERGRVVGNVNGEEFPLMIGKGGMKRFIALTTTNVATPVITPIAAGGNNITLESYGQRWLPEQSWFEFVRFVLFETEPNKGIVRLLPNRTGGLFGSSLFGLFETIPS